ncbi:MAG: hypothetical protein R2752_09165 [Vicinamibacterales bacterium]
MSDPRRYRAGESIEDYCRACHIDRIHAVMAADATGRPIRVVCSYCRSEHNYRGGPRMATGGGTLARSSAAAATGGASAAAPRDPAPARPAPARRTGEVFPIVTDRERSAAPVTVPDASTDLETLIRRVIREEAGVSAVVPAEKWRGGDLVLRPGTPGLQEKTWPIETFFHKVVMLRNRLRTLEQQLNASDLPEDTKVKLQSYITGCYGSLTSFNVLFADPDDQFSGSKEG